MTMARQAHLHRFFRDAIKCFIVAFGIALLGYLLTPQSLETLDTLRQFTPVTVVNLINDSTIDCLPNLSGNLLDTRPPCKAKPIIDDWPKVGHWAVGVIRPLNLFVATLDVGWHLVFSQQVVVSAVSVIQLLFGFGISVLIVQRIYSGDDFGGAVILVIGPLIFGATATWIVFNLIAILYIGLSNIAGDNIPALKHKAVIFSVFLFSNARPSRWRLENR
jgi:hypothetical protein